MKLIVRVLRLLLAADTLLGAMIVPAVAIGCAAAGFYLAALTFAGMTLVIGAIYWRYWRRYPLGRATL